MTTSTLDKAARLSLLALINDTSILPVTAKLDSLGSASPSASIQQLDGSRMVETYVDGSGVAESPFAVLYRVKPDDSDARADTFGLLMDLADELERKTHAHELPAGFNSIVGVSTPTIFERDEDGSEVWRCAFVLESERGAPAPTIPE